MDVEILPDRQLWWTAVPFWLVKMLPFWFLFTVVSIHDLGPFSAFVGSGALVLSGGVALGLLQGWWWRRTPGRTAVLVQDGTLYVVQAGRVREQVPLADVRSIRLAGPLDWTELLVRRWMRVDWWAVPSLWVETAGAPERRRAEVLLWGRSRLAQADALLNAALLEAQRPT